jgi:predicted DNA-binding antitoxin AbrB/MazE fold protein
MSIRVKVANGVLVPLDPLPPDWQEGDQFPIERNGHENAVDSTNHDDKNWQELEEAVSEISEEDFRRMQAALDDHRREAKDWMRRRMGLS